MRSQESLLARGATAWFGVVALMATAACGAPTGAAPGSAGDAAADSAHSWDKLSGADRQRALLKAAKKEGTLTVYSAFNDESSMAEAFEKKYGIKVDVYNANSETVLQRVVQESRADKVGNDVLIAPASDMEALSEDDLFGTYFSEYRDRISEKGKGDRWTGLRRLAFVAGWNTTKLKASDVPTSYADFADPRWRGRISLEYSDIDWYASLKEYYESHGMSEDDFQSMFEHIAQNSRTAKGHTVQGDLLAAGQFGVALSLYTQTVDQLTAKGAHVSYGRDGGPQVGPVIVRYDAGAVMSDADNPAGAALYLDFELSKDGFAVDKQLDALPPIPGSDDPLGNAKVVELDVQQFVRDRQEVSAEYDQLLQD